MKHEHFSSLDRMYVDAPTGFSEPSVASRMVPGANP